MMPLQRACAGESQVRNKLSNGPLRVQSKVARIQNNFIHKTVEAEITAMMPLQRACAGESQVRNKLSNGPLRVQSKVPVFCRNPVFCNVKAYVSCRGYVGILLSAW